MEQAQPHGDRRHRLRAAEKKEDPETLAKVLDLLRQHPQYADRFTRLLDALPAENRDLYLFMIAARWADDVRNEKRYHRSAWHYVNFPYRHAGETVATRPPAEANILTAFGENLATLKGDAAPHDRAVALCWLFHLVGDVHQPHTTALFTSEYPDGDKGGKLVFVRARPGGAILNLHALLDGLILGGQRFQDVQNTVTELRLRPEFAKPKLTELTAKDFEAWAKASFDLAVKLAYLDGMVPGSPKRDEAPVLPDGYTTAAKAAAERQVVLAGYRVAEVLRELVVTR